MSAVMEWKQKLKHYDITTILFSWSTCIRLSKVQILLLGYHRKLWRALCIYFFLYNFTLRTTLFRWHQITSTKHQNVKTATYSLFIPQNQFLYLICLTHVVDIYFLQIIMLNYVQTFAINIKQGFINSITVTIFHDRYFIN